MTLDRMPRRTYLAGMAAAGVAGVAGCAGADGTGTGTLATQVTDQPGDIADFESCVITVVGMWVGPATESDGGNETSTNGTEDEQVEDGTDGNETEQGDEDEGDDDSSGREYYEFDEPQEADLVQLQDGETELVDERELEVGEYAYLQLDTDGVDATLAGGESAEVRVPGNAPLTFNEPFEVRADTRTTFTADFTPVRRGQIGRYNLQPVPQGITVSYEDN